MISSTGFTDARTGLGWLSYHMTVVIVGDGAESIGAEPHVLAGAARSSISGIMEHT